jgi:hypothetical protein
MKMQYKCLTVGRISQSQQPRLMTRNALVWHACRHVLRADAYETSGRRLAFTLASVRSRRRRDAPVRREVILAPVKLGAGAGEIVRLVPPSGSAPVELLFPFGLVLRLAPDINPDWLRQLLGLLGVAPS